MTKKTTTATENKRSAVAAGFDRIRENEALRDAGKLALAGAAGAVGLGIGYALFTKTATTVYNWMS